MKVVLLYTAIQIVCQLLGLELIWFYGDGWHGPGPVSTMFFAIALGIGFSVGIHAYSNSQKPETKQP